PRFVVPLTPFAELPEGIGGEADEVRAVGDPRDRDPLSGEVPLVDVAPPDREPGMELQEVLARPQGTAALERIGLRGDPRQGGAHDPPIEHAIAALDADVPPIRERLRDPEEPIALHVLGMPVRMAVVLLSPMERR